MINRELTFQQILIGQLKTSLFSGTMCGIYPGSCCNDSSLVDSVDISYYNTGVIWDDFGCNSGYVATFRSKDTIWEIKNFDSINFQSMLPITDTAHFKLAFGQYNCQTSEVRTYPAFGPSSCCCRAPQPKLYLLVKTRLNYYLIIKVVDEHRIRRCSDEDIYTSEIWWWLQTDGSLNFNELSSTAVKPENRKTVFNALSHGGSRRILISDKNVLSNQVYFDCQGRAINKKLNAPRKYQVLIRAER